LVNQLIRCRAENNNMYETRNISYKAEQVYINKCGPSVLITVGLIVF